MTGTDVITEHKHFCMEVSYDGSEFFGWQIQPDQVTVQKVVQDTLKQLYGGKYVKVQGSSRTDAGVHALALGVSFTAPTRPDIPMRQIKIALNSLLPSTIRVKSICEVDEHFNARFSSLGKAYAYVINTDEQVPFSNRYSWHQYKCQNVEEMRKAAQYLIGRHDFSSFTVYRSQIDCAVRTIYDIEFKMIGRYMCIIYKGDGFLYKMIRCLTGALVAVGCNRLTADDIKELLDAKDRGKGQVTAPPQGLFLMKVFYGEDRWQDFELDCLPFSY